MWGPRTTDEDNWFLIDAGFRFAVGVALVIGSILLVTMGRAHAHSLWANGAAVPAWVRSSCCGPNDAHLLEESQVHAGADGFHIDGLKTVVPYDKVLPSQDGRIWGFWDPSRGPDAPVYCFFYGGSS